MFDDDSQKISKPRSSSVANGNSKYTLRAEDIQRVFRVTPEDWCEHREAVRGVVNKRGIDGVTTSWQSLDRQTKDKLLRDFYTICPLYIRARKNFAARWLFRSALANSKRNAKRKTSSKKKKQVSSASSDGGNHSGAARSGRGSASASGIPLLLIDVPFQKVH